MVVLFRSKMPDVNEIFYLKAFIGIVREALDQLFILKKINRWQENSKCTIKKFIFPTLEERFSKEENRSQKIQQEIEEANLNVKCFKENFYFVEMSLEVLLMELKKGGDCGKFKKIIENVQKEKIDDEELMLEASRNEREVKRLQECIENEKVYFYQQLETYMTDIGKMKDEIEDFKVESDLKLNYIKNWLNSKREIQEMILDKQYRKKIEEIEEIKTNINREERIHQEFVYAHQEFEKDLNNILKFWKEKYEQDLNDINNKIKFMQQQHDIIDKDMENLKQLYEKRAKEIHEYEEYKRVQELLRLERQRQDNAATKIAAWWKGVMVRKGFGKFKKKKEKKPKKKTSAKKS